jgi:hypothetical protein
MPGINPLRPPDVNEVLRREKALREELQHRGPEYYGESLSLPKRKRKLLRNLAKFITGRSEKKDG